MLVVPLQTLVADGVRETCRAGDWSFFVAQALCRPGVSPRPGHHEAPRELTAPPGDPACAARSVPGKETRDANSRLRHGDQPGARRRGPGGARGKSAPGCTAVPAGAETLSGLTRRPGPGPARTVAGVRRGRNGASARAAAAPRETTV